MDKHRYCPISGNMEIKLTQRGFDEACAAFRKKNWTNGGGNVAWCGVCRGKVVPEGITIIELADFAGGEVTVGGVKRNNGTCETCGREASILSHFGKSTCNTCSVMRGMAKNNPNAVFQAIKDFDNWSPHVGEVVSGEDREKIIEQVKKLKEENDRLVEEMNFFKKESERLQEVVKQEIHRRDSLGCELNDRTTEVERLREEIKALQNGESTLVSCTSEFVYPAIFWTLLERRLAGKVNGITFDDFKALAGLPGEVQ